MQQQYVICANGFFKVQIVNMTVEVVEYDNEYDMRLQFLYVLLWGE